MQDYRQACQTVPWLLSWLPEIADHLLTQPLQIVIGSKTGAFGSHRDGYELFDRARSSNKHLFVVEGASHYDLYDKPECVEQAMGKLGPFFKAHL